MCSVRTIWKNYWAITTIGKSRENSLLYEEWNEYHATPIGENTYEAMGTIWKVIDKE